MLQNTSKTLGFKKNMVYKTPPMGEVNHIWLVAYLVLWRGTTRRRYLQCDILNNVSFNSYHIETTKTSGQTMQNQLKRLIMSCFNWVYAVLNFNFFISDILDVNSYMNGIWNY